MNKNYEQRLRELAVQLVTPERFGAVALTEVTPEIPEQPALSEVPTVNLGSLFD